MSDQFVGEVRLFGCNFAPTGWATCDGQLMPIGQNTALFSLVGTYYGGNGVNNFALPNLRDNLAVGVGNGAGLTPRQVGETGGSAAVTLLESQMPPHAHGLMAALSPSTGSPSGAALSPTGTGALAYHAAGAPANMAASALAPAGQSQPHENRQPALALNFCIALQGVFPPRA
jgi:microcystin-dependent protein